MNFVILSDCVDPEDPQGRTYKQVNAAKQHTIPVGALVELIADPKYPSKWDGVRAFVVHLGRDCDQTPLYYLSMDREDTVPKDPRFRNPSWQGGWQANALQVIRLS